MYCESKSKARVELFEICRLAYTRGYLCGTEGNLSIRVSENLILSTASNTCKGLITESEFVLTDLEGVPVGKASSSKKKPSTELKMHLLAYQMRPDIGAVMHAHPTVTVGLTVAGKSLSPAILPEIVCTLGRIPVASYATPSTQEVPESIRPHLAESDAIVLDHHGAITLGTSLRDAYFKMEMLEHHAQTLLIAEMLGGAISLSDSQVANLLAIRSVYGLTRPVRMGT